MAIYYSIYSVLVLYCFFFRATSKQQDILIKVWIIIITLFGGLRWHTGYDWDSYLSIFRKLDWSNFLNYSKYGETSLQTIEPLYAFFNVLTKSLFGEYFVFNILECFIIHYSYYRFSKYHVPQSPILCFCFLEVVLVAFFPVRQTLAMAVLLWGFRYIKERRLLPFLFVVLIAFSIHRMAIAALPLYWIGKIHIRDIYIILLFFSFLIIGKLLQNYFSIFTLLLGGQLEEIASTYTENQTAERNGLPLITIILNTAFFLMYLFFRRKFNLKNDDWYNYCLNSFVLFFEVMAVFSQGMADLTRLICIFLPGHCLLFSSIVTYSLRGNISVIPKSGSVITACHDSITQTFCIFSIVFFFAYFLYKIVTLFNDYFFEEVCLPYRTIFDFPFLI